MAVTAVRLTAVKKLWTSHGRWAAPTKGGAQEVAGPPGTDRALRAYDARGNVAQRTGGGVTVTYTYDGLDRVKTVSVSGGPTYTYGYDERGYLGKLTSVAEPDRTVTYDYDGLGRRNRETVSEAGVGAALVTSYVYAPDGALSSLTYPSGLAVRYDRDAATREVTAVVNVATGQYLAASVTHAPGGPLTGLTFGNGLALSQGWNLRYEPLTVTSGPERLSYLPSPSGDVSQISDTSQVLSGCFRSAPRDFQYDFLDRLASSPGWLGYGYDGNGNRLTETVEGAAASWSYATGTDRLADRRVAGVRTHAFAYDPQGNVSAIGKYDAAGTTVTGAVCLRHDQLGRLTLVGATSPSGVAPDGTACTSDSNVTSAQARFRYDASNRRIARQEAATGQWSYTISDPSGNPLSELNLVSGAWVKARDYVWLDGRPLAQVEYPTRTPVPRTRRPRSPGLRPRPVRSAQPAPDVAAARLARRVRAASTV